MRVVFLGNLAGGAYMMARPVAKSGVDACLMLARWEGELATPGWEGRSEPDPRSLSVVRYGVQFPDHGGRLVRLVNHARLALSYLSQMPRMLRADVIQSFTCSLFVSRLWFLAFGVLGLRPYIACATGSDLRELAVSGTGLNAWISRQFFRRANVVLLLNLDMQRYANQIGVINARFFPFSVDTALFASTRVKKRYCDEDELLVFMPSHLDWGIRDNAPGRTSTKGNDRLIRAFARFIRAGGRGHLVLLNRGPDRELARQLVDQLSVTPHVTFRDQMMKQELIEHFNMADIVADQFDIGAFGTTTLEAMACSKPVLVYVDVDCADQCYSDRPPVLNARSEDDILKALQQSVDGAFRDELGKQARDWVVRHHDASSVAARLIEIYRTLEARC